MAVEIQAAFARMKKVEKTRWERVTALSLKPLQLNLKITASCNKRVSRVSTLINSSMKFLLERRPSMGVMEESPSYTSSFQDLIFLS